MSDWGMSGRRDSYRLVQVDPFTLVENEEIEFIPSECSLTYGYYTDNYLSSTLVCPDTYTGGFLRLSHEVTLPDGTQESEVLGTLIVDSAERTRNEGFVRQTLTCYSTLWRLSQDYLPKDFVRKSGQTVEGGIRAMCTAEGAIMLTSPEIDTTATHSKDVRFPSGENRLESLNTYCGWKNWQLTVDDYGRQILQEYTPPNQREIAYTFEAGDNCVYLPDSDETYTGDICNRVVAKWSRETTGNDGLGLSDVVTLDLPDSNPLSYQVCGRRITTVLNVATPVDHVTLTKMARDYLSEHDAAIRYFEIEHVGIPNLRAGDVVEYLNPLEGQDALLCEITQMDISALSPLMMTRSKLKVIE